MNARLDLCVPATIFRLLNRPLVIIAGGGCVQVPELLRSSAPV